MKSYTKKYIGAIFTIVVGLLSSHTFAIMDCPTNAQGLYVCSEYQVCNNPGGICGCNVKPIQNNSLCYVNRAGKIIKIKEVSAYAISGNQIVFSFAINNTAGDKTFTLDLHPYYTSNPKVKIIDLDHVNLKNMSELLISDGLASPEYTILSGESRTILITGEIVSTDFGFDIFDAEAKISRKVFGFDTTVDRFPISIYPIADFKLTQEIQGGFSSTNSGSELSYLFTIKNIGSAAGSGPNIKDIFPISFLNTPSLFVETTPYTLNFTAPNIYSQDNVLSSIQPGEQKTFLIKANTNHDIFGGETIINTGIIGGIREFTEDNNISVLNYTVPVVVDLSILSVNTGSEQPESSGNLIGFTINYKNNGNYIATGVYINASISGIMANTRFDVSDLNMGESKSFTITGTINNIYSAGTKFCLSGNIAGANENSGLENNILPQYCYTFVDHADVKITANLTSDISNIASGDIINYNINLSNIGGKIADGITLQKQVSPNLVIQNTGVFTKTYSLNIGESIDIPVQAKLISYPVVGTSIMFSGTAIFAGIELDTTNNNFVLNNNLAGLADVYITHSQLPFSGFRQGDKVAYLINYGNSGYRIASGTTIDLMLPSALETSQTNWTIGDLTIGQSGSFIVTGTLKNFLAAGTQFTSWTKINTPTAQTTTGNDISVITGTIGSVNSFAFDMSARNITNPRLTYSTGVGAIAGDIIEFTLNYANNGNVEGTNTNISFDSVGGITGLNFSWNLNSLTVGQSGSITTTGRIIGGNFNPINVVSHLRYGLTGDISDLVTIVEPYSCGDGYITKDEPCDTNVLNTNLFSGQVCEIQANRCVVTTKFITNTACITFNNTGVCSNVARIDLTAPKCGGIQPIIKLRGSYDTEVTCRGEYTNTGTTASINCGYGSGITGFVDVDGIFKGRCSYRNADERDAAKVQCGIGADDANPDCKIGLDGCEVRPTKGPIVIVDDQGDGTRVTCKANDRDALLKIRCNNNSNETIPENGEAEFTDKISGFCHYTTEDYDDNPDVVATCEVDNVKNTCSTEITLDKGIFGVCGDGRLNSYEQCDLGEDNNNGKIGNYLDDYRTRRSGKDEGKRCNNCSIENKEAYSCLSINNANISVQKGEYLPFRWRMYDNDTSFTNSCNSTNSDGKIVRDSMKCEFQVQAPDNDVVYTETKDCNNGNNVEPTIFKYFNQFMDKTPFGKYLITPQELTSFVNNKFGEYKIRISKVRYDYCKDGDEIPSETDNVCETNFVVTKPYLVQKSAFSTTPKSSNINLDDFYDINGDKLVNRTDLANISILDTSAYGGNDSTIDMMMQSFANKAEKLAVKITSGLPKTLTNLNVTVKKVPNKDIYILSTNSITSLDLNEFASITKPFTIITKNINLVINGNIDVNGMFLVQNGTISFKGGCDNTQIVKGIFVTDKGFNGTKNLNDQLNKSWCNAGGLNIKGVLIGDGIETLVNSRRSSLANWFHVSGSDNSVKIQRRNQIFRGASVLIEYSPDLRSQLPPGAEEFTKTLDVYKK